jgi:hypothetical protein
MNQRRRVKAQAVSEYSVFLAILLIAIIAMNVYIQRGLQGRYADVVDSATGFVKTYAAQTFNTNTLGYHAGYTQDVLTSLPRQYEPGYLDSQQTVDAPTNTNEVISSESKIKMTFSSGTRNVSGIDIEKTDGP